MGRYLTPLAAQSLTALNTNGDEAVDVADAVALLSFLFAGGQSPVVPFPDCALGRLAADRAVGCETPPSSCADVPFKCNRAEPYHPARAVLVHGPA